MSKIDSLIHTVTEMDSLVKTLNFTSPNDTLTLKIIQEVQPPLVNLAETNDIVSGWLVLFILGMGTALFFLLSFLKRYVIPIFKTKYKASSINILWYRINVLLWLIYALFAFYLMIKASIVIALVLILSFILVSHQFLIDFFIGVYFKFENQIRVKDNFNLGDLSGEIVKFNSRHLKIVNPKSETILIPYRKLLNSPITITKLVDNLKRKTIRIQLEGPISVNLDKLKADMKRCPWVYNDKQYRIEHVSDHTYEVHIMAKEAFTFNKVEAYLMSKNQ